MIENGKTKGELPLKGSRGVKVSPKLNRGQKREPRQCVRSRSKKRSPNTVSGGEKDKYKRDPLGENRKGGKRKETATFFPPERKELVLTEPLRHVERVRGRSINPRRSGSFDTGGERFSTQEEGSPIMQD